MSQPPAIAADQPASFMFSSAYEPAVEKVIAKYPNGRQVSAVLPLLDLAQRQHGGWVPQAAMEHIACRLGMAKIRVMEIATFYTMINLAPVGKYHLQVCGTTPCMLRGADEIFRAIRDEIGIGNGETSDDGQFTCTEVECLGACVNAPMAQVNDDFVEDLSYENFVRFLRILRNGGDMPVGSMIGRRSSEPEGGVQALGTLPTQPCFDPAKIYGVDAIGDNTTPEIRPVPTRLAKEGSA